MNLLREVAEKVNRPFEVKLAETKDIIKHHLEEFSGKCVVAFSGGKDSEVVLWLCLQQDPDIAVVYNNTGVEYPQTVEFVSTLAESWNLNLTVTHPEKSFWDCMKQYGFPQQTKWGRWTKGNRVACCYWVKEKPFNRIMKQNSYLGYFTGETAIESRMRMFASLRGTCLHLKQENVCKIKPILWWIPSEVWQFIYDNQLPINEIYNLGADRVGCMPCTAHKYWEAQMQRVNPKLYRIIKLRKDNQYVMALEILD